MATKGKVLVLDKSSLSNFVLSDEDRMECDLEMKQFKKDYFNNDTSTFYADRTWLLNDKDYDYLTKQKIGSIHIQNIQSDENIFQDHIYKAININPSNEKQFIYLKVIMFLKDRLDPFIDSDDGYYYKNEELLIQIIQDPLKISLKDKYPNYTTYLIHYKGIFEQKDARDLYIATDGEVLVSEIGDKLPITNDTINSVENILYNNTWLYKYNTSINDWDRVIREAKTHLKGGRLMEFIDNR